jgi:ABC-type glycerol-3-phosphate transport system substrate-binding protein
MNRVLLGGLVLALLAIVVLAGCGGDQPAAATTTTTAASLEPITSIPLNTDDDPMISIAELRASYARMREIVNIIAKHEPTVAAELEAKVAALENTLNNDPLNMDLNAVRNTASEILTAYEAVRTSQ